MNVYLYAKRIAIAALIFSLIVAGFYFISKFLYFLLLVFAGILLAVMFSGITNWIKEKTHLNRGVSLFLGVVLIFGIIIGVFLLLAPSVSNQFSQLGNTLPQSLNEFKNWLNQYSWGDELAKKIPADFSVSQIFSGQGEGSGFLTGQKSLISKVTGVVSSFFSVLVDLLIVLVTALFFAASPKLYVNGFVSLFAIRNHDRLKDVLQKMYVVLKKWLLAMLISMTIVGITTAIAYLIIGLPVPYALAVLAFFFEFIPNFGPWLAGIPAVLIGFTNGAQTAFIVAIVFLIIQLIESFWLIPMILKKAIKLPPALLLFFQVLLGIAQGVLGLLLAAPLLAVLMVAVQELWIEDVIKDKPLDAAESDVQDR